MVVYRGRVISLIRQISLIGLIGRRTPDAGGPESRRPRTGHRRLDEPEGPGAGGWTSEAGDRTHKDYKTAV